MIVKFITVRFRELANDPLAIVIYRFCIIIFASMSYPNFSSLTYTGICNLGTQILRKRIRCSSAQFLSWNHYLKTDGASHLILFFVKVLVIYRFCIIYFFNVKPKICVHTYLRRYYMYLGTHANFA